MRIESSGLSGGARKQLEPASPTGPGAVPGDLSCVRTSQGGRETGKCGRSRYAYPRRAAVEMLLGPRNEVMACGIPDALLPGGKQDTAEVSQNR